MPGLDGVSLRRSTTAQQVADLLSERILAGVFAPGERLRESAVAADLGVARSTVREAVRILELTGLVRYQVHRGAVVISPSRESIEALYTARERLETAAVARPASVEQVAGLHRAFQDLADATASGDVARIVCQDLAFHAVLVGLLDSARLDAFFAELTQELRFYLTVLSVQDREYERPDLLLAEHRVILEAVSSRDTERAVREVGGHVRTNADRVVRILTSGG